MTVNKITTPPTPQGQIDKINEIIDNTVVDQTYSSSSTNAQSGVALSSAKFLQNTAGNSTSLTVFGNASNSGTGNAINIGYSSTALNSGDIAMGRGSNARGGVSIALGFDATVSNNCSNAIQLGTGTNSTANTFNVGFRNVDNYLLLDGTTGLIPDARLSSNIARTSAIPTVNNATLTLTQGGTTKGTFTANAGTDVTIDLDTGGGGGLSYSADCPAITPSSGVATWSITHNLNSEDIVVSLYNSSGAEIEKNVAVNSANAITVTFNASSSVSAGDYKIVVLASGAGSNISNMQTTDNLVTAVTSSNTHSEYPSAKALYDLLFYKSGDVYEQVAGDLESSENVHAGFLTSDAKSLRFTMYLPKSCKYITTATVSVLNVNARGITGYINSSSALDLATISTITANVNGNRLNITCNKSSAFSNASNNTPIAVAIRGIKVTFS